MLELTGVASILRGISILYWIVAGGALIAVLWWIKPWWGKLIGALVVIGLFGFLPAKGFIEAKERQSYAREAWAYFKKLCDEKSGQKIYKTFTGVKSVLVVKPLPPATEKDLYDQFWYGDPYSNATPWEKRAESAAGILTLDSRRPSGIQKGLEFVEIKYEGGEGARYQRISSPPGYGNYMIENIPAPISRFGVSWEDISTPDDRKYWVAGSRLRVINLTDNSVVAERIGYFIEAGFGSAAGQRRPWLTSRGPNTTCPPLIGGSYSDQWFVLNVLIQEGGK